MATMTASEKYELALSTMRRKCREITCFGEAETVRGLAPIAKNAAMGGALTVKRIPLVEREWIGGIEVCEVVGTVELDEHEWLTVPSGNGRMVQVLQNPKTGRYEAWGPTEGRRDRENRLEREPKFDVSERYAVASTLEEPGTGRRTVRIAREDRCVTALDDQRAAEEASEAEAA